MALLHGKGRLVGWSGVGTQKDAEAVVDVACVGGSAMAVSTAPVEGMAKPGTAAQDALGRTDRATRVLDGPVLVEARSVGAPLPDVAVHVAEAPRVWLEPAHRRRDSVAVVPGDRPPVHLGEPPARRGVGNVSGADQALRVVAGPVARGGAGTAGVLPLRLGRQLVLLALFLAQPLTELDRVVPR